MVSRTNDISNDTISLYQLIHNKYNGRSMPFLANVNIRNRDPAPGRRSNLRSRTNQIVEDAEEPNFIPPLYENPEADNNLNDTIFPLNNSDLYFDAE